MNKQYREPYISIILLVLLVFEFPVFNFFLLIGLLLLLISVIFCKRRPVLNFEMLILTLFIVLYFVIDDNIAQSNDYKIWYSISTISLYTYGYYLDFEGMSTKDRSKKVEFIISVIALSFTLYLLVTIINSLIHRQFSIMRNPLNLWTGTLRAATHYGTMSIIPLAFGLYLIISSESKWQKRIGVLLVLFIGLVAVMTASRTILLLILIGLGIGYFSFVKMQGAFTRKNLNQLIGVILLTCFSGFSFALDLFNIKSVFLSSQLGIRYLSGGMTSLENDGRWEHVGYFFNHIEESLWGGGYSRIHSGNLHNVYLNVYDLSGIIPFLLLVLFTVFVIRNYKRLCRNKSVDASTRLLLLLVLVLSFIQMLLEPAMESVPVFMWCIFLVCGMQRKVSRYFGDDLTR